MSDEASPSWNGSRLEVGELPEPAAGSPIEAQESQASLTDSRQIVLEAGPGWAENGIVFAEVAQGHAARTEPVGQMPVGGKVCQFNLPDAAMAANPTPTNDMVLLARCHDLIKGCEALEAEIGLKQNTAAAMQAAWDAARAALSEVGRVKTERGQRRKDLRDRDREGEVAIGRCRLRLTAVFGTGFNTQWGASGFPDRSTMVPEVFAKRLSLLSSLALYFNHKPEHQSTDMGATAAICQATFDALSAARSAVNHNKSALRTAVLAKNKALKNLRQKMRGLIQELGILLTDHDPRWLRFGLKLPARLPMPEPVERVTLEATGEGKVFVQCPPAPHATRYRVQWRRMGAAEFTAAATVHEPEAWLQDLPPCEFIEVRIIAANKAGEAAPSPTATVMVR